MDERTTATKSITVPKIHLQKLSLALVDRPTGSGKVRQPESIFHDEGGTAMDVQMIPKVPSCVQFASCGGQQREDI
jgi:hypothetical protein